MDPEDVLDFGEDDDGLDVISLGGSDHDGQPFSNHSTSTILDPASPHQTQTSSPKPNRRPKSPSPSRRNGSDRCRRQSLSREPNPAQAPDLESKHQPAPRSHDRPIHHTDRLSHENSSRNSDRSSDAQASRNKLAVDRPKPGERASYMPPDRLRAISNSSRSNDTSNSRLDSRRPLESLPGRIADRREIEQKASDPPSSIKTKPGIERAKLEESKDLKKPVEPVVNPAAAGLPEGWISRVSRGGKTYYVNVFTRTSQWTRPTEPATNKSNKLHNKTPARQPVSESIGTCPEQNQVNVHKKNDVVSLVDSIPVVDRSQKQTSDPQACTPAHSLSKSSSKVKPDNEAAASGDFQSAKPSESYRSHETSTSMKDDYDRQLNYKESRSTQVVDGMTDRRSIPQEQPNYTTSESYPRDHRIHPDRLQEIAAANPQRPNDRSIDPSVKASNVGSFRREAPPHLNSRVREAPRRGEFARYPQESDTFPPRANPRPRSISPVRRHRVMEREPRETVQLSGPNGIPTAPGRSFPSTRTLKPFHEIRADVGVSRYQALSNLPNKAEPFENRNASRRREPDYSLSRGMRSPGRDSSNWSRRQAPPVSPVHPSHHRLESRAKSPFAPRNASSSLQDSFRDPLQPDLYPSDRTRLSSASNRVLREYHSVKSNEGSDYSRRNTHSRYDAYRPSSTLSLEANSSRPHASRRSDAYPSKDQGKQTECPPRLEPGHVEPRRSQMSKMPVTVPESPVPSKGFSQPDLYRPLPLPREASRLSPRRPHPIKYYPLIDLEAIPNQDEPYAKSPPTRSPADVPSERQSAIKLGAESCLPSTSHLPDQTENPHMPLIAPSTEPGRYDGHEAPGFSEIEVDSEKNDKASSDILEIVEPPPQPAATSPRKSVSLAKRLGPVADHTSEDDSILPPTKKHRQNPVEPLEAQDIPDDLSRKSSMLPMPEVTNPDSKAAPISLDPVEKPKNQSTTNEPSKSMTQTPQSSFPSPPVSHNQGKGLRPAADEKPQRITQIPDRNFSSPSLAQDKGISLRGRAARKPEQVDVAETPRSTIDDRSPNEGVPISNGSLRDRIQDLNFSPVHQGRPRHSYYGAPHTAPPDCEYSTHMHGSRRFRSRFEMDPPTSRHISERISGLRLPVQTSPTSNGSPSSRYVPRQSDSGWNGRRTRYP